MKKAILAADERGSTPITQTEFRLVFDRRSATGLLSETPWSRIRA
jgi:hypothetical protein